VERNWPETDAIYAKLWLILARLCIARKVGALSKAAWIPVVDDSANFEGISVVLVVLSILIPALFAQYIHTKLLIMFVPHGSLVQIRFWHV
jgi:hypothetical protein